jgi:hypothetical protein
MAAKKKKTKKNETELTETNSSEPKKLDVNVVSVAPAKLPPNKRLFPASLLKELDEIKERLEKIEQTLATKSE